jgi:hypothetical protein
MLVIKTEQKGRSKKAFFQYLKKNFRDRNKLTLKKIDKLIAERYKKQPG